MTGRIILLTNWRILSSLSCWRFTCKCWLNSLNLFSRSSLAIRSFSNRIRSFLSHFSCSSCFYNSKVSYCNEEYKVKRTCCSFNFRSLWIWLYKSLISKDLAAGTTGSFGLGGAVVWVTGEMSSFGFLLGIWLVLCICEWGFGCVGVSFLAIASHWSWFFKTVGVYSKV